MTPKDFLPLWSSQYVSSCSMGTFLDPLSDSSSVAFFIARIQSTAPKIAPTKNDFKGDIFDLSNKLLRWFDMSGFGVLLLMSWGLITDPLSCSPGFFVQWTCDSTYHRSLIMVLKSLIVSSSCHFSIVIVTLLLHPLRSTNLNNLRQLCIREGVKHVVAKCASG